MNDQQINDSSLSIFSHTDSLLISKKKKPDNCSICSICTKSRDDVGCIRLKDIEKYMTFFLLKLMSSGTSNLHMRH